MFALVVAFSVLTMRAVVFAGTTEAEARSAIGAAQEELVVCYQAVANASSAGANVTGLIVVLDQAGWNLSRADLAYKMGDFTSAQSYAVQSLDLLDQSDVRTRADALRGQASQARFWDFMINVVGSLVGTVVVACSGIVVWSILKKRYKKSEYAAK